MMPDSLSLEDKKQLLTLARRAIEQAVQGKPVEPLDLEALPAALREPGVAFVTLTEQGNLRGCVGAMEAYQSLAEDVQEHAVAAALNDYRFYPVEASEVDRLEIEISRLTPPQPLPYEDPQDLIAKLRPGLDGVLIRDGLRRATFLPQVWEKLPRPEDFLDHLCQKMGAPGNLWRLRHLDVSIYQVEEFHEEPQVPLDSAAKRPHCE